MKKELSFFTDRVGYSIHRLSTDATQCGAIVITSSEHAKQLFDSQNATTIYTLNGKLVLVGHHIAITFDGRRLKLADFELAVRFCEGRSITLENPTELPPIYAEMYTTSLATRSPKL